jgi:hypothetical protein
MRTSKACPSISGSRATNTTGKVVYSSRRPRTDCLQVPHYFLLPLLLLGANLQCPAGQIKAKNLAPIDHGCLGYEYWS